EQKTAYEIVILVVADENCAEIFACPLRRGVSANDEFLFVDTLEFDPCAASAAGFVNGVTLFPDNSFQPAAFHFFQQKGGVAADRTGITDWFARTGAEFFQNAFAGFQMQRDQTFAFKLEKVERIKINWSLLPLHFARLQKLEGRTALLIEGDHLSIEHAFVCGQILYRLDDLGETCAQIVLITR